MENYFKAKSIMGGCDTNKDKLLQKNEALECIKAQKKMFKELLKETK